MRIGDVKVLATDRARIVFVAAMVALLALGAVELSRVVAMNMLRADAEMAARGWTVALLNRAGDIPQMFAGAKPSAETMRILEEIGADGKVYRWKFWSRDGALLLTSDGESGAEDKTLSGRYGARVAHAILHGAPYTRAHTPATSDSPLNPDYYAVSCIADTNDGEVTGVFEVYVDETSAYTVFRRACLLTGAIVATMVLLAGLVPGILLHQKMAEHRAAREEAQFLADHDSLTGLANRRRLDESAVSALAAASVSGGVVAVFAIDVDRFKEVNDTLGHGVGDCLLRAVAGRLEGAIRKVDLAARLGGDEFLILQTGLRQASGAKQVADRLQAVLREPYYLEGVRVDCSASIGVAVGPMGGGGWDELVSCADAALYGAKSAGRNTIRMFEPGMDTMVRQRRSLEADVRRAVENEAFQLAYQPIFGLADGGLVGFEALLRWPAGWAAQSPATFVPIAEETGLIVPLGAWVLESACRRAASWPKPLKVAVNLSPVQFRGGQLVETVERALRGSGIDPWRLELEVTESVLVENFDDALEQLTKLRGLGISIALDDFGTGCSNLSYLWKFPFDKVKIDRSFVTDLGVDAKAGAIVATIVALGRIMNLVVTAEGVETRDQAADLQRAGCDQIQGYWCGRPMADEAVDGWLDAGKRMEELEPRVAGELVSA